MRSFTAVACLAILLGTCDCGTIPPLRSVSVDKLILMDDATVALIVENEIGPAYRAYCTGVWIDKSHILTARHCVIDEEESKTPVKFASYRASLNGLPDHPSIAIVAATDATKDLALLSVADEVPHSSVIVAGHEVSPGEVVHSVGQTRGLLWSYSPAYVSRVADTWLDGTHRVYVQVFGGISFGNSGGGLFNFDGELAGIASRKSSGDPILFYVPAATIRLFLSEVKR